jgi:replicative DNA helicase
MNDNDSVLYNLNIERAVLSAIIFEPPIFKEIASKLKEKDFYLPFHQHLFTTIEVLIKEDKPVDEEFIKTKMMKTGNYNEVYMLDVISANPISNVDAYCDDLVKRSQKRSLKKLGLEISKMIDDDMSPDEILQQVREREETIAKNGVLSLQKLNIGEIKESEAEFWCKNWLPIPVGVATSIDGIGGTGKGWLALQLALRLAQEGKRSYLWFSEDVAGIVKMRYNLIKKDIMFGNLDDLDKYIDISDRPPLFLLENDRYGNSRISDKFYAVRRELDEYDMVLFDPLLAFYGGDENNNSQARLFMQPFMNWAMGRKKAIIFLHHSKKDGGGFRGAGAFMDAMRSAYEITTHYIKKDGKNIPDPSKLHLKQIRLVKDNYGASLHIKHLVDRHITPAKSAKAFEVVYEDEQDKSDMPVFN